MPHHESVIRWDDEEWEEFARLIHEDNPNPNFMESPDLATLTTRDLCNAGAQMRRPRHFVAIGAPRKKLLEAFARLREKRAAAQPGTDARFHRAPPPAPPASPLKLDERSRPITPPAGQAPKTTPAPDMFAPVAWTRSEWLAIATEIDRMYPLSRYPDRERLTGLTSEDVAFAQRILPVERQIRHVKVASFSTLLPALLDAFRELKANRIACETEHAVLAQAQTDAMSAIVRAASPQVPPAAQPPATQPPAPALAAPLPEATPAAPNPWEAAFAPLLDHVLGLLTARLKPMLAEMIDQALLAPVPSATPAPSPAPAPEIAAPTTAAARAKTPTTPRLRIGIFGNRTSYANDLKREFPEVKFTFIDSAKEADSVKNCDRVLVLTKFVGHQGENAVRRLLTSEQFVRVNGCLADIRRVVTGVLRGQQETAPVGVPALA